MYRLIPIVFITLAIIPSVAFAHATPLSYEPASSAVIETAPEEVVIHFSERLDSGASIIRIENEAEEIVSGKTVIPAGEPRALSVPMLSDATGVYRVTWSVVSADDGHFTRGTYAFVVGEGVAPPTESSEVVQISTTPEAVAMTVELMGNGILWAALILFALARGVVQNDSHERVRGTLARMYTWGVVLAATLIGSGATAQIFLKSQDLAQLHDASLYDALSLYLSTTAGSATLYRLSAAAAFTALFFIFRSRIFVSARVTIFEGLLALALLVFAFFRAVVSHATANPFHPELSTLINVVHLVEKDVWAGTVLALLVLALMSRMRQFLEGFLSRAFVFLALNLVTISVTASYIVWLHLKHPSNLFSAWGEALIPLLIAAALLVGARTYHVVAHFFRKAFLGRTLHITLGVEFALALLVVYASSVIIITSPPLHESDFIARAATSEGVHISFETYKDEDGMILLALSSDTELHAPVVSLREGRETLRLELDERFENGYVFPAALLPAAGDFTLSVIVPREGAYDASAEFFVSETEAHPQEGYRPLDAFTIGMLLVAVFGAVFGLGLARFSRAKRRLVGARTPSFFLSSAVALIVCVGVSALMHVPYALGLTNPYRALCEADGNMWHMMTPTWEGRPVASISQEGCMGLMGEYHVADKRLYDELRTAEPASVSVEFDSEPLAGIPVGITIAVREPDGSPAELFLEHEKLLHTIVVSADMREFAHIHPVRNSPPQDTPGARSRAGVISNGVHPDDARPLAADERANSRFHLTHTFPKNGEYIIAVDYAHKFVHESRTFRVQVGAGEMGDVATYPARGTFSGYDVAIEYPLPFAGELATFNFTVEKGDKPVTTLQPYLAAPMHVAIVKHDLSEFIHTHGEVHDPDLPLPPIVVRNGRILHTIESMYLPPAFGPNIDAHTIFPTAGLYTIFGEFNTGGEVVTTAFTVRVE